MHEYPLWLLLFVVIPLLALAVIWRKDIRKYWMVLVLAPIGSLIVSVPWDYIAVKENIWSFSAPHIFGVWWFGLPLEEYLFIILVTQLFCVITIKIAVHNTVRT